MNGGWDYMDSSWLNRGDTMDPRSKITSRHQEVRDLKVLEVSPWMFFSDQQGGTNKWEHSGNTINYNEIMDSIYGL